MITVGFKSAKAEKFLLSGATQGRLFRCFQGEPGQRHWKEDLDFVFPTDELRASPNSAINLAPLPLGSLAPQESLCYGAYHTLQ